jgi:hypothetical protein
MLWVREEHYAYGTWQPNGYTKLDRKKWKFVAESGRVQFTPPDNFKISRDKQDPFVPAFYKRLGRFMPKAAARIWLEITSISIERLQDITDYDAVSEGIIEYEDGSFHNYFTQKGLRTEDGVECLLEKGSFQSLWCAVNGVKSWEENPWVWVIQFKLLSTAGKPKRKEGAHA